MSNSGQGWLGAGAGGGDPPPQEQETERHVRQHELWKLSGPGAKCRHFPTAFHADDLGPEGWKPIRAAEETRQLNLLPLF